MNAVKNDKTNDNNSYLTSDFDFEFGKLTLDAGINNNEDCGSNGLPLISNSISIIGNYNALIGSISHRNLVEYLDCYRAKNEKVNIVFEHYNKPFNDDLNKFVSDLLTGLHFLHNHLNLTHGNITPDAIIFDGNNYKWTHWILNTITENGKLLGSSILLPSNLSYIPPERVINLNKPIVKKSDIWSFGLVFLKRISPDINLPKNPATLISYKTADEVLKYLLNSQDIPEKWRPLLLASLKPLVRERFNTKQLMELMNIDQPKFEPFSLESLIRFDKPIQNTNKFPLTLQETYYFWCLLSPVKREKESNKKLPSILTLPCVVKLNNPSINSPKDNTGEFYLIPSIIESLPLKTLKKRLKEIHPNVFYPLILSKCKESEQTDDDDPSLPLVIRENDFSYQCERTVLFRRLTSESPFLLSELINASKIDIPPFYRAQAWAAILGVKWADLLIYEEIDKLAKTSTDRQISVDIPRCHQYNDLLASPQGHKKLTRILKAWLCHNESNYVYWQGLDSLLAPFVVLNFCNESMAFASFNAFIDKYLKGFFCKDNSPTIQEYLAIFSHLIAFHDVTLFNHLQSLNFTPQLYSIPWFLTMFTHVLPLHKIVHVWDTLLLGDETFPLAIGLAILKQLRDRLLNHSFNDCIHIFSELPEINIEQCVQCAIKFFDTTPKSACKRGLVSNCKYLMIKTHYWKTLFQQFPLEELIREKCPRLELEDVVNLISDNHKIVIVDGRSEEDFMIYGAIKDSIRNQSISIIKEKVGTDYYILLVVNDSILASNLVLACLPRVANLIHNGDIPIQWKVQN